MLFRIQPRKLHPYVNLTSHKMISRLVSVALLGAMATAQDVPAAVIEQTQQGMLRGTSSPPSPVKAASIALQSLFDGTTNSTAALLTGVHEGSKIEGDFYASGPPENVSPQGGNRFSLTVRPGQEAVRISSNKFYTGGRFEFRCRTASQMPGK